MYPRFVSFLGAAGLASALAYFGGVYLAFQPEWEQWAQFFVPWAIPLLLIPYVLLISHLYLRTRLGSWFLARGRVEEAIAYCEPRLGHNLLRSRKEALYHRVALARAWVFEQEYERAEDLLSSGYAVPQKGQLALEVQRWRMEVALRVDNLMRCRTAWEAVDGLVRPRHARAYVLACRAEMAAREGERSAFDAALDEALWAHADNERVALSQVLGVLRFSDEAHELRDALELLERIESSVAGQVPGRSAELLAMRAQLHERLGDLDEAGELLARAAQAPADARATHELRRVEKLIDAQHESHEDARASDHSLS